MNEVPFAVFESTQARHERTVKRLIMALIILVMVLLASNALWLYAWTQYDYTSEESESSVTVDAEDGVANYIGNDGDITNGENNCSKDDEKANTP